MDPISAAAAQFGILPRPRFFGAGGSPFQSLASRYALESQRMASVQQAMAMESDALQIQRQRQDIAITDQENKFATGERDRTAHNRDIAYALLRSFADRDQSDPSILNDLQRAVYKEPALLEVPEFQTAFEGLTSLRGDTIRADSQIQTERMESQRRFLDDQQEQLAAELASVEKGETGLVPDPADPKGKRMISDTKRIEDLRARLQNVRELRVKVIDRPLEPAEVGAVTGAKPSSAVQRAQQLQNS
jgi:hypothetical protein